MTDNLQGQPGSSFPVLKASWDSWGGATQQCKQSVVGKLRGKCRYCEYQDRTFQKMTRTIKMRGREMEVEC